MALGRHHLQHPLTALRDEEAPLAGAVLILIKHQAGIYLSRSVIYEIDMISLLVLSRFDTLLVFT